MQDEPCGYQPDLTAMSLLVTASWVFGHPTREAVETFHGTRSDALRPVADLLTELSRLTIVAVTMYANIANIPMREAIGNVLAEYEGLDKKDGE